MQTLLQYYSDEKVLKEILNSVENSGHRVWKCQFTDGSFAQNRKKINSVKKLKEFLLPKDKIPSKVYVSVARFIKPEQCYGKTPKKAQWLIADSLFLGSDLLFDLDGDGKDFITPHNDGKIIIKHMKKESYELKDIYYSARKGIYLIYKDNEPITEKDPLKRLKLTQKKREELVKRLPKLKTIDEIHKGIIADQFRIHAVVGTIKAETGHKVQKMSLKDFMFLSTERLTRKICIRVVRPVSMVDDRKDIPQIQRGKEGTTLTSSPPYYYNFIDNVVKGIDSKIIDGEVDYRYVTVLKYPQNKTINIRRIQETYNLSDFYRFVHKDLQIFLNFKLVDRRRLEKIMKFAKSMNLNSFMFYGHSWFPISETKDKDGNIICEKPILKEIIKSDYGLNDTHSRPHANLLKLKFKNMAGKKMNNVCKAMVDLK